MTDSSGVFLNAAVVVVKAPLITTKAEQQEQIGIFNTKKETAKIFVPSARLARAIFISIHLFVFVSTQPNGRLTSIFFLIHLFLSF